MIATAAQAAPAARPEWMPLSELALALGVSRQAIHQAAGGWTVRKIPGVGDRGLVSEVLTSSLPADVQALLWPAPAPVANEVSLQRLNLAPEWARERAQLRLDLISSIEERLPARGRTAARRQWVARYNDGALRPDLRQRLGEASLPTYLRWLSAYRGQGLAGLLPQHKGRLSDMPPDVEARLGVLALEKPRSASLIYEYLTSEYGPRVPSYHTVRRAVARLREAHREECLYMHKGAGAHKHKHLPALGDSSAKALYPNHFWEIDSSPADLLDVNGRRHKVMAVVDIYTRRYHLRLHPAGSGMNIAQTLRSAILAWGLPDVLMMDNGLDYQSRRVQGLCAELGITVPFVPPYAPEKKPHVERAFRTISKNIFGELQGFTGNNLLTRPEDIVCRYTAEELQEMLDKWATVYWHERQHNSTGRRPREAAGERAPRRVSDERVLDILLGEADTRTMRNDGIHYRNRKYWHDRLLELAAGAEVLVREDYADVGRIYVFVEGAYHCTATDLEVLGLTPADYTALQRKKISLAKAKVEALRAGFGADPDEAIKRFLDQRQAAAPAALPGPRKVVNFPALEAAASQMPKREQAESLSTAEAGEPPVERPAWWLSDGDRYKWALEQLAHGGELLDEDLEAMAEYEASGDYRALAEYWDSYRRQLGLRRAAGL